MVQLLDRQICGLDHSQNPIQIAVSIASRAGVVQHRFSRRGDKEHSLSTFRVDVINVERFVFLLSQALGSSGCDLH